MNWRTFRRWLPLVLALLAFVAVAAPLFARVGGGQGYSGGRSSGRGGGGGDGIDIGTLIWLLIRLIELHVRSPIAALVIDAILIAIGVYVYRFQQGQQPGFRASSLAAAPTARDAESLDARFEQLRRYDPNFSEPVFLDFAASLYTRLRIALGAGKLESVGPYLTGKLAADLAAVPRDPAVTGVTNVIVGAASVANVSPPRPVVTIAVRFETNYAEALTGGPPRQVYAVERWTFSRKRDVLSRVPEKAEANNCPNCGGALELTADGTCQHCGVRAKPGQSDWAVTRVEVLEREVRGPRLGDHVPESGTDFPTVRHPRLAANLQRLQGVDPAFAWPAFEQRAAHVFRELQAAWSERKWEKARPFETDALFGMHRYWIEEYQRQKLRNALGDPAIGQIEPVKVLQDAFYDAITVRIFARMTDATLSEGGAVVSGDPNRPRAFSEYWTFLRRRNVASQPRDPGNCPNCGAALKVNAAGVCDYCGSKITGGAYDWVASRIEQDESYRG